MSENIEFNEVDVICHCDGSVEWKHRSNKKRYRTLGQVTAKGYRSVEISGKVAAVHRLIGRAYIKDFSEDFQVDHIDGDKSNNCPSNLRMVSNSRNCRGYNPKRGGATSQYRGVKSRVGKWVAICSTDEKRVYLGLHKDEESAARSWDAVALLNEYHPSVLNFGVRQEQKLLLCALSVAQKQKITYA